MHLHLDGDVVKYRCGFAAEKMHYHVTVYGLDGLNGEETYHFQYKKDLNAFMEAHDGYVHGDNCIVTSERIAEPVENALHNVKHTVQELVRNLGASENQMTVYLSGESNFRNELGSLIYRDHEPKGYKANRDELHKPTHGPAIVDYIIRKYNVEVTEFEEADDAMGISHYAMWLKDPDSTCIVTVDKDLDMIPGWHYNFVKEDQYYIKPENAEYIFWRQLLTGDRTDNIPGLKGVGVKTADKMLSPLATSHSDPRGYYLLALENYNEQYGEDEGEQALLENARMIWIRRERNEFWNPPS
jgi:hypothetical protein